MLKLQLYLSKCVSAGADRVCTSETVQSLFTLAAGVLASAAAGVAALLKITTLDAQSAAKRHSGNEAAAAAAAVLGANVQNAVQILQNRPRIVACHQVCAVPCRSLSPLCSEMRATLTLSIMALMQDAAAAVVLFANAREKLQAALKGCDKKVLTPVLMQQAFEVQHDVCAPERLC